MPHDVQPNNAVANDNLTTPTDKNNMCCLQIVPCKMKVQAASLLKGTNEVPVDHVESHVGMFQVQKEVEGQVFFDTVCCMLISKCTKHQC